MNKNAALAAIVREWQALPSAERQTQEQALSFALKAMSRYGFHDYQEILGSLGKYVGQSN